MLTQSERKMVEAIKTAKLIRIEFTDSNGTPIGLTVTNRGGQTSHDIALAVQTHFNNLDKR